MASGLWGCTASGLSGSGGLKGLRDLGGSRGFRFLTSFLGYWVFGPTRVVKGLDALGPSGFSG
eukprot:1513714-Alexandrium_andersonii.AAC.1